MQTYLLTLIYFAFVFYIVPPVQSTSKLSTTATVTSKLWLTVIFSTISEI